MISNNEVIALKKITKRQKGTFQQVEESYLSAFKDTISLFNAAAFLCELLLNQVHIPPPQKLELEERTATLYLLLVSFQD
jgi:hypothetical protein